MKKSLEAPAPRAAAAANAAAAAAAGEATYRRGRHEETAPYVRGAAAADQGVDAGATTARASAAACGATGASVPPAPPVTSRMNALRSKTEPGYVAPTS